MIVIEFKVTSKTHTFNSSEEFLEFDYEINKETYSAHQWDETLRHGLANEWILNETTDFFNVESQQYTAQFFANTQDTAKLFLDSFMHHDYFHKALENANNHGLHVSVDVKDYTTEMPRGEKTITDTLYTP